MSWGGKMSRGPLVLVMEAAQDGPAMHSAKSRSSLRWPPVGVPLLRATRLTQIQITADRVLWLCYQKTLSVAI